MTVVELAAVVVAGMLAESGKNGISVHVEVGRVITTPAPPLSPQLFHFPWLNINYLHWHRLFVSQYEILIKIYDKHKEEELTAFWER